MNTTPRPPSDDWIPTRYSLLSRLEDWDDHESWKDFFDTYWRLIYSVAIKSGLNEAEAQDVVQETIISVAKSINTFKRDKKLGSFKGWLRNITRWRIADQFEKRPPSPADIEQAGDSATDPMEAVWDEEWQANLLEAAIERVKRKVREEHYQIFHVYTMKQWPVSRVARAFKVSTGQVYLIKHRIAGMIKKELRALENKPF